MALLLTVSLAGLSLAGLLNGFPTVYPLALVAQKDLMIDLEPIIDLEAILKLGEGQELKQEPQAEPSLPDEALNSDEKLAEQEVVEPQPEPFDAASAYPSFGSAPLDVQLRRYLNYLLVMGPPDIFIVGSSRATQGVDPLILQQALGERGYPGLKVFNWGINGATAQVVDVLVREILTPAQQPRLILWADGSRSFSSGRRDRTFENLVRSPGYRLLKQGQRPQLTEPEQQQFAQLRTVLQEGLPTLPDNLKQQLTVNAAKRPTVPQTVPLRTFFVDWCSREQGPCSRPVIFQSGALAETIAFNAEPFLEASGFQINNQRFNPQTYFQFYPWITGEFDGDYQNFSLWGHQHRALKRLLGFAQRQRMQVAFLSLPLTQTYLDPVRRQREDAFIIYMKEMAKDRTLNFYDFSRLWPNRNDFFIDPSHVNRYGAAAVSWQFAQEIDQAILEKLKRPR